MTKDSKDTNMGELITAMVGRSLESLLPAGGQYPRRSDLVHPASVHQICALSAGYQL